MSFNSEVNFEKGGPLKKIFQDKAYGNLSTASFETPLSTPATSTISSTTTSTSDSDESSSDGSQSSARMLAFPTAGEADRINGVLEPSDVSGRVVLQSSETLAAPAGPQFTPGVLVADRTRKEL